MNKDEVIHSLNGYIHNVAGLLKFIKMDAKISNEETREMLDIALLREEEVMKALENLKGLTEKND